jgi:2-polyprenyl-3-methyl-5-hydroxy-6-metoxy-1,4-benzoquinol methylase
LSCLACGSTEDATTTFVAREMMLGLREEFHIAECSDCGTLNLVDVPENLAPYYPSDEYYSFDDSPLKDLERLTRKVAVKTLWRAVCSRQTVRFKRLLSKLPDRRLIGVIDMMEAVYVAGVPMKGCRLLDVGSGIGVSTLILSQLGAEALGVDPFGASWKREHAEQRACEIADVEGTWDVILFQHSLEHLADPQAAMSAAKAMLSARGRVIVRIPASDSFARRNYQANWVDLDTPRHLFVPTRKGLQQLGERSGLSLERCYDDARDIQFWGSEQYVRDISLYDDASAIWPKQQLFSASQMKQWEAETERLNRINDGDLITAIFRAA